MEAKASDGETSSNLELLSFAAKQEMHRMTRGSATFLQTRRLRSVGKQSLTDAVKRLRGELFRGEGDIIDLRYLSRSPYSEAG